MSTKLWFVGMTAVLLGLGAPSYGQSPAKLAEQMKAAAKEDKPVLPPRDELIKMGKDGVPALEGVLADKSAVPLARVNAALALAKIAEESGGGSGTAELARYTKDDCAGVRYWALKGLINPACRYPKAASAMGEALADPAAPIRLMAIRLATDPRIPAQAIVNPKEDREVKEQAEAVFKTLTGGTCFDFEKAVKRDPNNPKSAIPDPDKEKAAIEKYADWLKKNK